MNSVQQSPNKSLGVSWYRTHAKAGVKNALIYDFLQADDISNFSVDFYQDGTGDHAQLQNGLDIYLTTNTDDPVAVWTTASTW